MKFIFDQPIEEKIEEKAVLRVLKNCFNSDLFFPTGIWSYTINFSKQIVYKISLNKTDMDGFIIRHVVDLHTGVIEESEGYAIKISLT